MAYSGFYDRPPSRSGDRRPLPPTLPTFSQPSSSTSASSRAHLDRLSSLMGPLPSSSPSSASPYTGYFNDPSTLSPSAYDSSPFSGPSPKSSQGRASPYSSYGSASGSYTSHPGQSSYVPPPKSRRFSVSEMQPFYPLAPSPVLDPLSPQPKKKPSVKKRTPQQGCCFVCSAEETPEWRKGPAGARTLCNACGLATTKLAPMPPPNSVEECLRQLRQIGMARFRCTSYALGSDIPDRVEYLLRGGSSSMSSAASGFIPRSGGSLADSPTSTFSSSGSSSYSRERDMEAALSLQQLSAYSPVSSLNTSVSSSSPYTSRRASIPAAYPYTMNAGGAFAPSPLHPSASGLAALTSAERRMSRMSLEDADGLDDLPPSTSSSMLTGAQRMSIAHLTGGMPPPPSSSPSLSRRYSVSHGGPSAHDYGGGGAAGSYSFARPPTPPDVAGRRSSMGFGLY